MLLRSSSTPILDSWLPHSKDCSSPEPEFPILQRTRSVSFYSPSSEDDHKQKKLTRNLADLSIQNDKAKPREKKGKASIPTPHSLNKQAKKESDQEKESEPNSTSIQKLFSSSRLGEKVVDGEDGKDSNVMQTLVMGGGAGNDGGKIYGGAGGRGGGSDGADESGGSGFFESNNHGSECDSTDVYYQKMIEANPGNPLLLGNYAKFLKEIRGDFGRAEECCGRAIVANPNDVYVLSLYSDLIWQNHRDVHRAESYFDQAVKTAPDDCFVLASYAKFLWDVEDEEEEKEKHDEGGQETEQHGHLPPPDFFLRPPRHLSLSAAS